MRHPIDDIFKRGLADQEHSMVNQDWFEAKAMLDLEKRKKRIPIWWFGMAAGVLLISLTLIGIRSIQSNHTIGVIPNSYTIEQKTSSASVQEIITAKSNDPKSESTDIITSDIVEAITETPSQITKTATTSTSTSNRSNSYQTVKENQSDNQEVVANPTGSNNFTSQANLNDSNNVNASNSRSEINTPNRTSDLTSVILNPNVANRFVAVDNGEAEFNPNVEASLFILTQEINKLAVPFDLPVMNVEMKNGVLVEVENSTSTMLSLGMYASYSIPYSKPSLGVILNNEFSNNWIASVGVGVSYRSRNNNSSASELGLQNTNGFVLESMLDENIEFNQFSLEIPVNIGYRIGKHSLAAIAIAEFNLWSELKQNTVISTNDTQDIPMNPVFGSNNDPITITQDSKITNEPSLSIPKYYIGMGYGYEINKRVRIQSQALWNMTLVDDHLFSNPNGRQSIVAPENRWQLRTTLIVHF